MKLSSQERSARQKAFRQMKPADKLEYLYTYYKVPAVLILIAAIILGSGIYRRLTQKDTLLNCACVNVSVGQDLECKLNQAYADFTGSGAQKAEVLFYRDLYLSNDPAGENHEYAYASRMKIMAAINSKELDVVLMNQEAYDVMSGSGYLLELPEVLKQQDGLYEQAKPYLVTNSVILEDNSVEYNLNQAEEYLEITENAVNGIEVSSLPAFQKAGFSGNVYLGIIANTPRLSGCLNYIAYLISIS